MPRFQVTAMPADKKTKGGPATHTVTAATAEAASADVEARNPDWRAVGVEALDQVVDQVVDQVAAKPAKARRRK